MILALILVNTPFLIALYLTVIEPNQSDAEVEKDGVLT